MFVQLSKPEPNMLKALLIIPSRTSQKFTHYSYIFYSHIITYYSHFILCINIVLRIDV